MPVFGMAAKSGCKGNGFLASAEEPVYRFGPDGVADIGRCRLYDANGDGNTWKFSMPYGALLYEGNDNDADDYIFLPPVELKKGDVYTLSMEVMRGAGSEILEVGMATAAVPATFKAKATFRDSQIPINSFNTVGLRWQCSGNATYYPVLRVSSSYNGFMLCVRNVELTRCLAGASEVYELPMTLLPTPAQAAGFRTIDGDGDGHSWRYQRDSLCFSSPGSAQPRADDLLVLPPFRISSGNYAFSFEARASGAVAEQFEVLFGPDTLPEHRWEKLMVHPGAGAQWRRWRALASVSTDSAATYRAAIRVITGGGDGVALRNFKVEQSADSLLAIPCTLRLDTTYRGQGSEWIFLPPFKAPHYKNITVEWRVRGTGPNSPQLEMLHGMVADTTLLNPVRVQGGIVNREALPSSQSIYCDAPHGQHFVAFHITGREGWSGGVIESVRIDTLKRHDTVPSLPYMFRPEGNLPSDTILLGPVWIDNTGNMTGIDVAAHGDYKLFAGMNRDGSDMTEVLADSLADTIPHLRRYMAVAKGLGAHYLRLVRTGSLPLIVDSIYLHTLPYSVVTPQAPLLRAVPVRPGDAETTVTVTLPTCLNSGMTMFEEGALWVVVKSALEEKQIYGYPGDTLEVSIAVPVGLSCISAVATNWAGAGRTGSCSVYAGMDAPSKLLSLTALPDTDNRGVVLKWHLDSIGVNGGYIVQDSVHYVVDLKKEEQWQRVAEVRGADSCIARLPVEYAENLGAYTWRVTPYNSTGKAKSDSVVTLSGAPLPMPVTENYIPHADTKPFLLVADTADSVSLQISSPTVGDPTFPDNLSLRLLPGSRGGSAHLLLSPFTPSGDKALPQLLLRVHRSPSAPSLAIAVMARRSVMTTDTVSLYDSVAHWEYVSIPMRCLLPDSLSCNEAATAVLTPLWHDTVTPLEINHYSIVPRRHHELLLSWQSLPDSLATGDANRLQAAVANIGDETINITTPQLAVGAETPVYSNSPLKLRLRPDARLLLDFSPLVKADYYGEAVPLTFTTISVEGDSTPYTLSTALPAGPGRYPLVVNLQGEFDASGECVRLRWGKPVWNPELGFREPQIFASAYNVYRDSIAVATCVSGLEYADVIRLPGRYTYYVTYVAGAREYAPGNSVTVSVSPEDLGSAAMTGDAFSLQPAAGGIRCRNGQGMTLEICRIDGTLVLALIPGSADETIQLPAGIYIARRGTYSSKIIVR